MKYLNKYGITAEKRIHNGWKEHQKLIEYAKKDKDKSKYKVIFEHHPMGMFGKWQWVFSSKKGNISMVQLLDYNRIGQHEWEIFCTDRQKKWKNQMGEEIEEPSTPAKKELEDIERFNSRHICINRVIEILKDEK